MFHCKTKLGCKRLISSEDIAETVIFWLYKPHSDFNLEDSVTIWLMMKHNHTKFGYKKLSSSDNIFWTKPDKQMDRQTLI